MGIDAQMRFQTSKQYSKDELLDLDYRFNEATDLFGDIAEGRSLGEYVVNCGCRYYGEDYARGPFPQIFTAILWLRTNIPDVKVYYGGDNEDYDELTECNGVTLSKLFDYWATYGHTQYDGINLGKKNKAPKCEKHYNHEMIQYGWHGDQTLWVCSACDYRTETNLNTNQKL